MKKIYSSLLYCGVLISLMSTNVYAIRAPCPGEKDWKSIAFAQGIWGIVLICLLSVYIIFLIICFIKSKKTMKEKLKKYGVSFALGIVVCFFIFILGYFLIQETNLYKLVNEMYYFFMW